jgi:hypothetical protein
MSRGNRIVTALGTFMTLALASVASASAAPRHSIAETKSYHTSGLPALLIILVILALIILGVIAVVRFIARKGKQVL